MARKTAEECEKTRQALLESALICFADQGIAHTSLADIAKHAGFTRGAIYWHFKNKSELFFALHQQIELPFDYLLRQIEACEGRALNFAEFYEITRNTLLHIFQHQRSYLLLEILIVKCEFTQDMQSAFAKLLTSLTPLREKSQAILAQFEQQNIIKTQANLSITTQALLSFLNGAILQYILSPQDFDLKNNIDNVLNLFFSSIVKDSELLQNTVAAYLPKSA